MLAISLFCFEGEELPSEGALRSQQVSGRADSNDHRDSSLLPGGGGDAGTHLSLLSNHFVGGETQFSVQLAPEWKGEAKAQ